MTPLSIVLPLTILGVSLGLSACTQFEPFQRQGTWHENRAPMQNIAIELANPTDLFRGENHPVLTGNMATTAIDSATRTTTSGNGTASGAGASGAGATNGSAGSGTTSGSAGGGAGATGAGMGSSGTGSGSGGMGGSTGGASGNAGASTGGTLE